MQEDNRQADRQDFRGRHSRRGRPPANYGRIGRRPTVHRGLIDIGEANSQVDMVIIGKLALDSIGDVGSFTASTGDEPESMEIYLVGISWAEDHAGPIVEEFQVIGLGKLAGLKVDMILGRDILNQCLMADDGPNWRLAIAYDRL